MHFARKGPAGAKIERRDRKNQQTKTLEPGLCPHTVFLLFTELHLKPPVWLGPKSNQSGPRDLLGLKLCLIRPFKTMVLIMRIFLITKYSSEPHLLIITLLTLLG